MTAATRATDNPYTLLAQPEGSQQLYSCLHFGLDLTGDADSQGIADTFAQELAQRPRGAGDCTDNRSRFGDT